MFVYQYLCFLLGIALCWYVWRWPRESNMVSHNIYTLYQHISGKLAKTVEFLDHPSSYDLYAIKRDPVTYDTYLRAVTAYSEAIYQKTIIDNKQHLADTCKAWMWCAIPCVIIAIAALPYLLVGFVCYLTTRLTKAYYEEIKPYYPYMTIALFVSECVELHDKETKESA